MKQIILVLVIFSCAACSKNVQQVVAQTTPVKEIIEIDVEAEKAAFKDLIPKYEVPTIKPLKNVAPKIFPPNWWIGMENPTVEIMIYGNDIQTEKVLINHAGVEIKNISKVENPNYLFVELDVSKAKAGKFDIELKGANATKFSFELKTRANKSSHVQGLSSKDVMYLIMPDRFANGDKSNDSFDYMTQKGIDRTKILSRHGGDLQGIIDHLDYLQNLGVTALWLNPVQTNDEPYESYHGYAITDHYSIDPRLGDNELYKKLVDEAHKRGIKIVMDIIQNHAGHNHFFIKDLPSKDWINAWDEFTRTTYRAPALLDPYASDADKKRMSDGWFDHHMPDLNQRNPHVAKFLIQNTIWWVEYSGLDGFRIDTYAYPDIDFSKEWMQQLFAEYENLGVFGETWVHGIPIQNFFIEETNVPGVTDFQLYYAINDALNNEQGWTSGIAKLYYTLAQDVEYANPWKNVVFLDNHDLSRYTSTTGDNIDKWKQGITWLLTTRGIPMLTYGTEHFMKGAGGGFGEGGRKDFPGGWKEDKVNYFDANNLEGNEKVAYDYLHKLLNYRKNSSALTTGTLKQFIPEDGVYVYFRKSANQKIMVVMNASDHTKTLSLNRFTEELKAEKSLKNVLSNEVVSELNQLNLQARETLVFEVE